MGRLSHASRYSHPDRSDLVARLGLHTHLAVENFRAPVTCVIGGSLLVSYLTRGGQPARRARRPYARVSTREQDLTAQVAALRDAGCAQVFQEKASGVRSDRAELMRLLRRLEPGDVLLVTRLDRLARSTRDLLNVLAQVTERDAGFRSLADAWADTTTAHGRLMLTVLGGLAEFERELIRARTGEGRKRARERGVRFGRKPKLTRHQRLEAIARREAGEPTRDIGRSYNVSHVTVLRLRREDEVTP